MPRFALFGDSYINHLSKHWQKCPDDRLPGTVRPFGISGLRTSDMAAEKTFHEIINFQPDVVFIIMGGNDLRPGECCRHVADRLADFHRRLYEAGISSFVAAIPWRGKTRIPVVEFNRMRRAVNHRLRKLLWEDLVDFHSDKQSAFEIPNMYNYDMVHPGSDQGGCAAMLDVIRRCLMSKIHY